MNDQDKYPTSMRVLHWLMALLILGQIFGGWFMTPYDEAREPLVGQLYWWHKSFGLLAFLFIFIRLTNRLRHVPPELPQSLPAFDRKLAHFAHWAIYFLIVMLPITGYTLSSTFEYSDGITFFGIHVPELFPEERDPPTKPPTGCTPSWPTPCLRWWRHAPGRGDQAPLLRPQSPTTMSSNGCCEPFLSTRSPH